MGRPLEARMITLYETQQYRLEGCVKKNNGLATLELFQTFPEAQHPRQQRICQLNLPTDKLKHVALWLLSHT